MRLLFIQHVRIPGWELGKQIPMSQELNLTFEILGREQVASLSSTSDIGKDWKVPLNQEYPTLIGLAGHFTSGRFLSRENLQVLSFENDGSGRMNTEVKVKFTSLVKGTDDFKALSPEKRGCYYPHEKKLQYFPVYSEGNCMLECTWEIASAKCKCVPWFLKAHFPEKQLCDLGGNACFKRIVDERYQESETALCSNECKDDCETYDLQAIVPKHAVREDLDIFMCHFINVDFTTCSIAQDRWEYSMKMLGDARHV